jgi:uncharacterized membrane protein YhhN
VWATKPLASAGFVATAVTHGALGSVHGTIVLAALGLCLVGDVLLIPRSSKTLAAGMAAFMLAHAGLAAGFIAGGVDPAHLAAGAAFSFGVGVLALRSLWRSLPREARPAVAAYTILISAMVCAAFAAAATRGAYLLAAGAILFAASDFIVARDRFVKESFGNQVLIVPAYYAAQTMLAMSVAG